MQIQGRKKTKSNSAKMQGLQYKNKPCIRKHSRYLNFIKLSFSLAHNKHFPHVSGRNAYP